MKIALVHDWFYINGGAEKVVKSLNSLWPQIEIFSLLDFLSDEDREEILKGKRVKTTFIQNLPTAKSNHRKFLQLFPLAIEQLDLRDFDVVLSSSSSVAKGVLTHQEQLHICYCHSPVRYAWDLYHDYLNESGLNKGLKGWYAKYVLHKIRNWDMLSQQRVDIYIANSNYIAQRIKKIYGREAEVIYPPVNTSFFELYEEKEEFYFTASRMVPYKKIDLIVKAFNEMPDKRLIVAGDGPELGKIRKIAGPNIQILGFVDDSTLKDFLKRAKAFVFAAKEDFGILPVEAQACGTPVLAFNKGGTRETVLNGHTGFHFSEQSIDSLKQVVSKLENSPKLSPKNIHDHALKFDVDNFDLRMKSFVEEKYAEFRNRL